MDVIDLFHVGRLADRQIGRMRRYDMAKTSGINQAKILEVAEAIIAAKGARDTSLRDIAKAVGISKGTLYYHYATKEALVYDITGRHFRSGHPPHAALDRDDGSQGGTGGTADHPA